MLYQDLGWDLETNFYYTIRPGDFSPLSPDADVLERSGKIGLDFWKWNRDRNPLGYTPPLCTCKRMAEPKALLRKYATGITAPKELRVCENDVCRGLLYIPYSMIEVPLNRTISNGSEFAKQVAVPDDTDVYCGSMKHTLVLCTTSRKHEEECLEAIRKSNVPHTLVYDVRAPDFLPYFKKRLDTITIAPLMAVEPIDSDVSDNEDNYGFGECFAVKHTERGLVIHKYDPSTQELSEIDPAMLKCWAGGDDELLPQEPVTQLGDYTLCELIESFSGERRPLKLSLRRTVTFNRRKELIHDDIDVSPIRIKRKLSSSGSCEIPEVVLENAHMHSVINAIDNITQ
uniref:Uncharacterized protein n=2 Tax=Babesia bovis TaxID=5865 RepID=A7APT1_BABBO|eukprot:XP_001612133.1 hypothetical protein [Babesia bovis T2Bo]